MKIIVKNLFLLFSVLALSACASGPTAYGPVNADSSLGFKHTQIQSDRARVSFTAKDPVEAQDYALLRAAELTLDQGFSHFKIIDGYVTDNTGRRSPLSTRVGVGVGSGGYRYGGSRTNVGVGIGVDDIDRVLNGDKFTNTIEVMLLHSGTSDPDVYDAQSVASSIKPAVFK